MTANMIKGKGFRGALRYNMEKVEKNVAEVLDHSFVEVSEKSIMKEIQMIKVLRPNLKKYFYHTSINFPPSEDLTNKTMTQIGQDYLKESGFTQHQYIMFRHRDAGHPHLHILVNRIGYDGKVMSDSNDFALCEKILRELEMKYNLTEVISSKEAKERAMTKDELEMMKRTNVPSNKIALQIIIKQVMEDRPKLTTNKFISRLEAKGVNILFNQASTGYVSGISYSYKGMNVTGSKLGNNFKWPSIKNSINYEPERDRTAIHETNARTKSVNVTSAAGNFHHKGNQEFVYQFGTEDKILTDGLKKPRTNPDQYSKQSDTVKQKLGSTKGKDYRDHNAFSKNSNGFDLAALMDCFSNRHAGNDDNQFHVDNTNELIRKDRRKKRRRKL